MADLKPCPFCGFPAVYDRGEAVDDAAHFAVQVVCTNCGASVEGLNRESARIGWNRRASPSPGEGRPKRGRCEGCGEEVEIDHGMPGAYGHTRSEHDCGGDERLCSTRCPIPVACGPVYVSGYGGGEDG